jgi:hypothetical protein
VPGAAQEHISRDVRLRAQWSDGILLNHPAPVSLASAWQVRLRKQRHPARSDVQPLADIRFVVNVSKDEPFEARTVSSR